MVPAGVNEVCGMNVIAQSGSPGPALPLTLLLIVRRLSGRLCAQVAQRAAENHVLPGVCRAPLRHLVLELVLGERYAVAEVDEHVCDRAVAGSLPVARIGNV